MKGGPAESSREYGVNRITPPNSLRRIGTVSSFFAVLIVSAMIMAPFAASASSSFVIVAPYKGSVHVVNNIFRTGCGHLHITVPAHFNKNLGVGGFAASAGFPPSCNASGGPHLIAQGFFGLQVPLNLSNGTRLIVSNWSLGGAGHIRWNFASCVPHPGPGPMGSYCYQVAQTGITAWTVLHGASNGTNTFPSNHWRGPLLKVYDFSWSLHVCHHSAHGTSGKNYTFSLAQQYSWHIPVHGIVSSHVYFLYMYFYAGVQLYSHPGGAVTLGAAGSGAASVDFATGGHGAVLNSITIT